MNNLQFVCLIAFCFRLGICRDEDKIMKACYWPHEIYEPCFGGCAEVSCDNPRSHLRPCYPYCEPGCVCEDPYVRDDRTHQCVLPQDCSPTQMGIPIPTKKGSKPMKYSSNIAGRNHVKREDVPEISEVELPSNHDNKKQDNSRSANYYNAYSPSPPSNNLIPRKVLITESHRAGKRPY